MLSKANFVWNTIVFNMIINGTSGCIHKDKRNQMLRNVVNVQQSCDMDAFLCQNELDFMFPQDLFATPIVVMEDNNVPTVFGGGEEKGYDPVGEILNEMINFSIDMTPVMMFSYSSMPETPPDLVGFQQQPEAQTSSSALSDDDVMDKIMEDMLSSFFESIATPPSAAEMSSADIFLERINNHGRRLLQEEANHEKNPVRERLARRLTSVQYPHHPSGMSSRMESTSSMPIFDTRVDQCLFKRVRDRTLLTNDCGKALQGYQQSNMAPSPPEEYSLDLGSFVVVLTTLFIFTTTTLLLLKILLGSSTSSAGPFISSPRNLKRSILNAVYANPSIKQQVEEHLGEEIGSRPRSITRHFSSPMGRFCASLPLLALTIMLCYLSITDPIFVILVGAPVVFALGCYSCCAGEPEDEEESTSDVEEDCEKCHVTTTSLCGHCTGCVNCCECVTAPLVVRQISHKGDAVFVAVPAVI